MIRRGRRTAAGGGTGSPAAARGGDAEPVGLALARLEQLLHELDALSRRQAVLIDADDDGTPLLALIQQRRRLVERIAVVHRELVQAGVADFGADSADGSTLTSPGEATGAATVISGARPSSSPRRILELARTIIERDQRDRQRIQARRDAIAQELAGVVRGRTVSARYVHHDGVTQARFHDRHA